MSGNGIIFRLATKEEKETIKQDEQWAEKEFELR